jgi:hypothetical protein
MTDWDNSAAVAVVGLATYEIWNAWQNTAPSLAELRSCVNSRDAEDNIRARQQLMDANYTVGSLAALVGIGMLLLTKKATVLMIVLVSFTVLSFWYHSVLAAPPR